MKNDRGVDIFYFRHKLNLVIEGLHNYTPAELARELARLSRTAHSTVLLEPEFQGQFLPGSKCTVNGWVDLMFYHEAKEFIGQPCILVKRTKGGLYQVALESNPKKVLSVPQRNITLKEDDEPMD